MATGRRPSGPDIPDLEQAAPSRSLRPSEPRTSARPAEPRVSARPTSSDAPSSPQDYFGSGNFDSGHFEDPGDSLELDIGVGGATPDNRTAPPAGSGIQTHDDGDLDVFQGSTANAAASLQRAATSRVEKKTWPTGRSPDSASIRIDAVDVALTADFGTAPTQFVKTPAYALRVWQRKRKLGDRIKQLGSRFAEAERERDHLVVSMVRDLRGKLLMTEQGETLFAPVVEIERTALDRRAALAGTSAEYDRRSRELDEHGDSLGVDATAKRTIAAKCESALAEQRRLLERAEAKKKRLYIEVRVIVEAAEKSGAPMTDVQAAKLEELEAEVSRRKPEVETRTRETAAAQAALGAAESDVQRVERKLREVDRLRSELDKAFQKQIGARSEGVEEANRTREDALVKVGVAVLEARGRLVDVPAELLDTISRAEKLVFERATDLEKAVRALDSYDKRAFQNGIVATVAAVTILFAIVALVATR